MIMGVSMMESAGGGSVRSVLTKAKMPAGGYQHLW